MSDAPPDRDPAFAQAWNSLGLDATAAAVGSDPEARLASTVAARPGAHERPDPLRALPRLTVAEPAASRDPHAEPVADLVVEAPLGEGGMGVVRLARQAGLERDVAVKTVRPERLSRDAIAALIDEARISGQLEHPAIVPVYALGRDAHDRPVLVMKRITGTVWRELIRDPSHPGWARADAGGDVSERLGFHLAVLVQVARALEFAHARGVVHRDLKSENVMIGDFGEVYLLDWGLAVRVADLAGVASDPGSARDVVGTPAFMAPEMLRGTGPHITPRTDVYLLGATLHEVLTGRTRHTGQSRQELLYQIFTSAPVAYPPEVPAELGSLANRATHAEPDARPASAAAFREAIAEYVRHQGSHQLAQAGVARLGELRRAVALAADTSRAQTRGGQDGQRETGATGATGATGDPDKPDKPGDPGDPGEHAADAAREVQRLWGECGFAFRQALAAWHDNPRAREGLDAATVVMVEHALARRDAQTAAALLAGLASAPADLARRAADLARTLEAEARAVDALRAEAHDRDVRVAAGARAHLALVTGLLSASVPLGLAVLARAGYVPATHGTLALALCAGQLAALVYVAPRRATLFANAQARGILAVLFTAWASLLGCTLAARAVGIALRQTIPMLSLPLAVAAVALGALVARPLLVTASVYAVVTALSAAWPAYGLELFAAGNLVAQLVASRVWSAIDRRPHA